MLYLEAKQRCGPETRRRLIEGRAERGFFISFVQELSFDDEFFHFYFRCSRKEFDKIIISLFEEDIAKIHVQ